MNYDHVCHAVTLYLQALSMLDDNEYISDLMPVHDKFEIVIKTNKETVDA